MATRITGAYSPKGGGFGPVRYNDNLYVVLQEKIAAEEGVDDYALFKSTDEGATWSVAESGQNVNVYIEGVNQVVNGNFMHGCLDNDFPSSPYGYFVHLNTGDTTEEVAALQVTRVNFDTETFDAVSAVGPNFYTGGTPEGAGNDPDRTVPEFVTWAIAQFDDGSFAVLASLQSADDFTPGRVYYSVLTADLSTWSGRNLVLGQSGGDFAVSGIARGISGRVHGFVWSDSDVLYHTLLSTGSAGELEEIAEVAWNYRTCYSAALSGSTVRILCVEETANVLVAYSGVSSNSMLWVAETVDDASLSLGNDLSACIVGGSQHYAGYTLNDGIFNEFYLAGAISTWATPLPTQIDAATGAYDVMGNRIDTSMAILGFVFALGGDAESYFVRYTIPTPGGAVCCCKIVGIYGF